MAKQHQQPKQPPQPDPLHPQQPDPEQPEPQPAPPTPKSACPPENPTAAYRPEKPVHGGLFQISNKEFVPYTGGKPSRDFREFQQTSETQRPDDGCMRKNGRDDDWTKRTKGLTTKL